MIRRPPRSTLSSSSAASDVYKRQEMAHDENIESSMVLVRELLDDMFKNKDIISFSDLLGVSPDKVITFISLLFLANRRDIWLEQEALFGEPVSYTHLTLPT